MQTLLIAPLIGAAVSYRSLLGYFDETVTLESAAISWAIATAIIFAVAQVAVFVFEATSERPSRRPGTPPQ